MWQIVAGVLIALSSWTVLFIRHDPNSIEKTGGNNALGSGEMFDAIAPRYDLINKLMSLGLDMRWRRAMIAGLQLQPGDRVLDLATGTADVAILLSQDLLKLERSSPDESATESNVVLGIDPSSRMLEIGRSKAEAAGHSSRIDLRVGNAQKLSDIPDGSIDKVTMAFGIRNVPDRLEALKEIRRILARKRAEGVPASPGGEHDGGGESSVATGERRAAEETRGSVVAILELQDPESGILAFASRAFVKLVAPLAGLITGHVAEYGHLRRSTLGFPSVAEWTALMNRAGLEVFSHKVMGFGAVHLYLAKSMDSSDP